ncbi:MAG: peptide chain release factor N(5)-glutamine methyltransferase [Firmicutes bacterium]|nr:peptide chain release factor N(5)-glutamine methyltransferase [Bacillota bacterium]
MNLTIGEVLQKTTAYFAAKGIESARLDAELLLAHVLGLDRVGLYTDYHRPLTSQEVAAYREVVARRGRREPVAYITGHKEFYGLDFTVTPAVLIPRPETELLVETVLEYLRDFSATGEEDPPQVIEIGVGSGAISVALAVSSPSIRIYASEISQDALAVARENIKKHGLEERITLVPGSFFSGLPESLLGRVKVVVSNPPYLTGREVAEGQPEVKHEPRQALYGGPDGLAAYRQIISEASNWLRSGGLLALEIGSAQAKDVVSLIGETEAFSAPEIRTDYAGLDRIVLAFLR